MPSCSARPLLRRRQRNQQMSSCSSSLEVGEFFSSSWRGRSPKTSRALPFGNSSYPRLLGLPALNGTHPYPQFALWSRFDPERRFVDQYNRYAHVWFTAVASDRITIDSPFLDQVRVSLPPTSPVLDEFRVRFFLVISPEDQFFDRLPQFSKIFSHGRVHIYQKR